MDDLQGWEDDFDLIRVLEAHSSRPPSNILPAKRPLRSQISPTTDGILNRFKKQNATQTLADPTPSIPPGGLESTRNLQQSQPLQRQKSQARVCRPNHRNRESSAEGEERIKRISIPGPAGAVQRALHKKVQADATGFRDDRTRGIASGSSSQQEEDDVDFKEAAWLSAMDYLQRERPGCSEANFSVKPTIGFIRKRGNIDRIPQVLGIIKTCTPNKLGSMFVTLKDPTGTICGSIHHKVMKDSEFGRDISAGAVLLLRQVAVFSPNAWANYLNITITNVEKVFKKGSCLPGRQDGASTSKNRSSIPPDVFMEAGSVRLSTDRASQQDVIFSPKKHEATNHILHRRSIDKNVIATHNHQQHPFTIDNILERRKAPPHEDNNQQRLTRENITPTKIPFIKNNVLKEMSCEQDPQRGTDCASENVRVYCNKKESISPAINWDDVDVELLMADPLDLFG